MRILTRYLLRAHLGPFVFSLTVLTALLLINTVARRFEELAGKGLPASVIAEVFVLSIPHILALTLPMAVLVAVLYTFSQLTADNEVTTLKASGINLTRLLVPLFLAASLVTVGMVLFNDRVLPETNHRLRNLLVDIGRKSPTLELEEQVVNEIEAGDHDARYYLQAGRIEPATNRLWDIVIYDLSQVGQRRAIYADSGRMAFNRERTDLFLTLHDGWIHEIDTDEAGQFRRLFFDQQRIRLEGVGNQLRRTQNRDFRGDREMSIGQLAEAAEERRRELLEVREEVQQRVRDAVRLALAGPAADEERAEPEAAPSAGGRPVPVAWTPGPRGGTDELTRVTSVELRTLRGRASALRSRMNQYRVEYHKKYSIPFACLVFVLIGAPLAVRFPRGGVGMVIAASLGIFSVYYMGLIGGEELADKGIISPFWAMWAPNVLFLVLGVWALLRIGREASTARGGGWDDLWYSLRSLVARPFTLLRRKS